jgi:hypothetical protein
MTNYEISGSDNSGTSETKTAEIVIDEEEFRRAQRDPRVIKFLQEAREYGERMEAEGLIHP